MVDQVDRLNGVISGLALKAPCKAVAIANITLSGEQTVNGVAIVSGDRVLVTAQTAGKDNGIYDASTASWTRSADFDGNRDVVRGTLVTVNKTTGQDYFYQISTADPITIDTTAITFLLANDPNVSFPIVQDEIDVGLTTADINDSYDVGIINRYGTNATPGTTDMTTAITNADLVKAVNGGTVRALNEVYAFSGKIDISQAVNLVGEGNSNIAGEATEFKGLNASAQIAFGGIGAPNGQRGGQSGDFKINGDSTATQPFYIGRSVHRSFQNIDINDGTGTCWQIDEAQNCTFININTFGGAKSLVLDKGAGGNVFIRLNLWGPTGYNLTIEDTTGAGPYDKPTHNGFYHSIFEQSSTGAGGCLDYVKGADNYFDQTNFSYAPGAAGTMIKVGANGSKLNLKNAFWSGNQTDVTAIDVAAGGSVFFTGRLRANAFLNLFEIAVGAEIEIEDYSSTATTNIFSGAGAQNTVIRSRIRTPKQFFRELATNHILMAGTTTDVGIRFQILADGKLGWDDGTDFSMDTNLYRSAADTLKTDDAFVGADTLTLDDTGTPSVAAANNFKSGGTTTITDFDDGVEGQTIRILAAHSVTITDNAAIILSGGANYDMTDTDTLTLTMYNNQVWSEDTRSVN